MPARERFGLSAVLWTVIRGQPIDAAPVVRLHGTGAAVVLAIQLGAWLLSRVTDIDPRNDYPIEWVVALVMLVYLAVTGLRRVNGEKQAESVLKKHALAVVVLALVLAVVGLLRVDEGPQSRWAPGVVTAVALYAIRLVQRTWLAPRSETFWVRRLHWIGLCMALVIEVAVVARLYSRFEQRVQEAAGAKGGGKGPAGGPN